MGTLRSKIIYEDETILVIYKPAGMATQTARVGSPDVVSELKNHLARTADVRGNPYLGVIHRLDQPVEGLLVFTKEKRAAAALTAQLQEGGLNKHYYAIVCGQPASEQGTLVDDLQKDGASARVVTGQGAEHCGAKRAVLHYHVRYTGTSSNTDEHWDGDDRKISLVDVHIDTGRFHQIRVQMSHAGHPLLGDARYGTEQSLAYSRQLGVRQVALCAYRLEFTHPATKEKMTFETQPEGWKTYPWLPWDKCF